MNDLSGMTVNERLYVTKLLDSFDLAVKERSREKLLSILKLIDINEEQANSTIDLIFSNPNTYGYE